MVSKNALYGVIFILILSVVLLLSRKDRCDPKTVFVSDKSADTAIAYLEGQIKTKDSISAHWHNKYLESTEREIKTEIIYVEKVKLINSGDIYFNDSMFRSSVGIGR